MLGNAAVLPFLDGKRDNIAWAFQKQVIPFVGEASQAWGLQCMRA